MKKNYNHYVIRLRKGKPLKKGKTQTYKIIVILNKKKTSSQKVIANLGFFKYEKKRLFAMNNKLLAYYLNKGVCLNNSVKRYIYYSIV